MKKFITTKKINEIIEILGKPFFAGIIKEEPCSLHQLILEKCKLPSVFVADNAEQLFLYGRNILPESIIRGKRRGVVVVRNVLGEPLGIGRFEKNILRNIKDMGLYLRSEDSC